jgi:hypothetical protein
MARQQRKRPTARVVDSQPRGCDQRSRVEAQCRPVDESTGPHQVGGGGAQPPGLPAPGLSPQSSRCVDAFIEEGGPASKTIRAGKNPRRLRMRRTPCLGKAAAVTALLGHITVDLWLRGARSRAVEGVVPDLPRALRALANEAVVTEDGPHPSGRAGAVAGTCERASFSPAVPPTCHKQRSPAVCSGQPRSLGEGRWAERTPLTWGGGGGRHCMACKGSPAGSFGTRTGTDGRRSWLVLSGA